MHLPIKIGIGLLGASAFIVPGVWMAVTAEPTSVTLADASPEDTENKDKFGEDFKHHMVSATNASNDAWWNWSFEQRWKKDSETKDTNFSNLSSATNLKEKCKDAYKQDTKSNMRGTDKETYERNVWRYCSLEGKKPSTVKEDKSSGDDSTKIDKANESELISTKDPGNSKFWEIQEKAFFKEKDGLGSKATDESSFKSLYSGKGKTLRVACQEIYEKTEAEATKDKKDVLAFCSLNPKKST